jgi:hypothetical protein
MHMPALLAQSKLLSRAALKAHCAGKVPAHLGGPQLAVMHTGSLQQGPRCQGW